jgi:hypothetical protein
MRSENQGVMLEIIDGIYKGKFAIAPAAKQHEEFKKIRKLFVRFFHDRMCLDPIMHEGKKTIGLINIDYCKQIGFVD